MLKYLAGTAGPSGFGSKSTADEVTESCGDMTDVTAIITGATSGIGAETARVLAKRGARLVLPARNMKAAEEMKARIEGEFPDAEVILLPLDLSSLSSVSSFASRFLSLQLPLHLLINNAGKFSSKYATSEDGFETTFVTNYLGHFLLTKLLLNKMVETAARTGKQGRIVNVSSVIHSWFSDVDIQYYDLLAAKKIAYDPTRAYALSKLAIILHTRELARRLKAMSADVTVNCVHPGVVRTRLARDGSGCHLLADVIFFLASKFFKTIPQAAATACYLAAHPAVEAVTGKYFVDCNEASPSKSASDDQEAFRLWRMSISMTKDFDLEDNVGFQNMKDEPVEEVIGRTKEL